jgi:hypothetical protein
LILIMAFKWLDDPSMIGVILKLASYTYGRCWACSPSAC